MLCDYGRSGSAYLAGDCLFSISAVGVGGGVSTVVVVATVVWFM